MAKLKRKSVFILLLVLCLALSLTLVACDNDPPEAPTDNYSVTVLLGENTPATGVRVTVKKGSAIMGTPKTVDANGKASFSLVDDSYTVQLSNLPANYEIPANADLTLSKENRNLTVTLASSFAYVVNLVNEDNTPFTANGLNVIICTFDGTCRNPVAVDNAGTAYIHAEKGNYHVKVEGLPSGYSYDMDGNGYYTGADFSTTNTEITIKIYSVTAFDLNATPMTTEEKQAFTANDRSFTSDKYRYTAHKVTVQIAPRNTQRIVLTADLAGEYQLFTVSSGVTFTSGESGGYFNRTPSLTSGKSYTIFAKNDKNTATTVEIVALSPSATNLDIPGVGGTHSLTINQEDAFARLSLSATKAGKFTATVLGNVKAFISLGNSQYIDAKNPEFINPDKPIPDEHYAPRNASSGKVTSVPFPEQGPNINNPYDKDVVSGKITWFIAVKAESYPVTIDVKIEKVADLKNTVNNVGVTGTLSKFDDAPEDKELAPVEISNSTVLVKGSDGFYHLGSVDGPLVVVKITSAVENTRMSNPCALALFETAEKPVNYIIDVTSSADRENFDKGNTYNDYRTMLRGFKYYEDFRQSGQSTIAVAPKTYSEKCYAGNVNADGVYPLTQDLYDFLHEFNEAYFAIIMGDSTAAYNELNWMYPLYYYVQAAPADPIVGNYQLHSITKDGTTVMAVAPDKDKPELTTYDSYNCVISKNGSFAINEKGMDDYAELYSGNWTKQNDTTYSFIYKQNGSEIGTCTTVFDSTNKKITVTVSAAVVNDQEIVYVFTLKE